MIIPDVTIISSSSGDWEALYLNGKKVKEGHSLEVTDVLRHLGIQVATKEIKCDDDEAGYIDFNEDLDKVAYCPYDDEDTTN